MEERHHTTADIADWVAAFNERERLYVLRHEQTVLGWGIIKKYSTRHGYRFAGETAVYLRPEARGQGFGSTMKRHLIEVCRQLKYRHLVAKIFASNQGSIDYNLKLGYELVGRQKEIGFKNGEWMDVVILQYIIN